MKTTIECSVDVAADVETLFDFVQDTDRRPDWDERVARARIAEGDPIDKGVHLVIEYDLPVTRTVMELEYVRFDRPRQTAVRLTGTSGPCLFASAGGTWIYEPLSDGSGGSRFTTRFAYEMKYGALGRLINRLFLRRLTERMTAKSLENLRRCLAG